MERYHDFPRLAKESGFTFPAKPTALDWKLLEELDVEAIACGRQFGELERCLDLVLNCDLDAYTAKFLDKDFVKLFRVSQLGIAYLSHCLSCLDRCVILLQDQLSAFRQESKEKQLKRTFRDVHKCKLCDKTFISESYLSSHARRRHGPTTSATATQTELHAAVSSGVQSEQPTVVNVSTQTDTPQLCLAATQTEDSSSDDAERKNTETNERDKMEALLTSLPNLLQDLNARLSLSVAGSAATGDHRPLLLPFLPYCCQQHPHVAPDKQTEEALVPTAAPRESVETKIQEQQVENWAAERRKQLKPHTLHVIASTSEESEDEPPLAELRRKPGQLTSREPRKSIGSITNVGSGDWPVVIERKDRQVNRVESGDEMSSGRLMADLQTMAERKGVTGNLLTSSSTVTIVDLPSVVDVTDGLVNLPESDSNSGPHEVGSSGAVLQTRTADIDSITSFDSDKATTELVEPPPTRQAFNDNKPLAASSPEPATSSAALKQSGRRVARRRKALLSAIKKSPPTVLGLVRKSLTSLYSAVSGPNTPTTPTDLATRLRELHVDPTWVAIPNATLKRCLDALAHNRRLLLKKKPAMLEARRRIEEVVEERVRARTAPQHTTTTTITPLRMYQLESESSEERDFVPTTQQDTKQMPSEVKAMDQDSQHNETRPATILKKAGESSSDPARLRPSMLSEAKAARQDGQHSTILKKAAESSSDEDSSDIPFRPEKRVMFAEEIAVESSSSSEWDLSVP